MRTIRLNLNRIPDDKGRGAINHLSLWAIPAYPEVDIYHDICHDGDRNFVAVYSDPANPDHRYVIGAVWSDSAESYSFHS